MSDIQPRPPAPRGRSSGRGGRGGYHSRAGRNGTRHLNGDAKEAALVESLEEQGEIGELKKKYSSQLSMLKEVYPDWTDMDLVMALEECEGDIQITVDKITSGNVSQFSDVKKKTKDRSQSKAKEAIGSDLSIPGTRGGRGRGGLEGGRAGRGRGSERGRSAVRGSRGGAPGRAALTPATASAVDPASASAAGADTATGSFETSTLPAASAAHSDVPNNGVPGNARLDGPEPSAAVPMEEKRSSIIQEGAAPKSWASIFAKPKPSSSAAKAALAAPQPEEEAVLPSGTSATEDHLVDVATNPDTTPIPPVFDDPAARTEVVGDKSPPQSPTMPTLSTTADLPPPHDQLTQDNVEHLPDVSTHPATETAASTTGSTRDARLTPMAGTQQPPIARPPMGGYATTAYKATGLPGRSASYQRKIMEQQEAVVMPGNHALDRAAVQFGRMGMNADNEPLDVEDDREEVETRTQPTQQSPGHPRASSPTAVPEPIETLASTAGQDLISSSRQAPGLPPAPQASQQVPAQQAAQPPLSASGMTQQGSQPGSQYGQFGRYGQPSMEEGFGALAQKPYEPFGQQIQTSQNQYGGYPNQPQGLSQVHQSHGHLGSLSSAPDYPSHYGSEYGRNTYQQYYGGGYNQQQHLQQPALDNNTQSRADSAIGNVPSESSYPTNQVPQAQPQSQSQSRYGDAQLSGHNTPNPMMAGHHAGAHQQSGYGGYPYGHPYYSNPHYAAYMNQHNYNQNTGYPHSFQKSSMYSAHPSTYVSPSSYEQHSSSPAPGSTFTGRDSSLGLDSYGGRSGSTQPGQSLPSQDARNHGGLGGMHEMFGRQHSSGFPGGPYSSQDARSSSMNAGDDNSLKPFGSGEKGGPSPSQLGGQPGRPGSATSGGGAQNQGVGNTGIPGQQGQFGGYGGGGPAGYGAHYGSLGSLGGGQQHHPVGYGQHQQSQYQQYGGGFGGSYGSYGRGGWGGNYGH